MNLTFEHQGRKFTSDNEQFHSLGIEMDFDGNIMEVPLPLGWEVFDDKLLSNFEVHTAFPNVLQTALDQALRESLEVFLDQVRRGWLTEQDVNR